MKAKLIERSEITPCQKANFPQFADGWFPAGHVLEGPRCFRLVQLGIAVPADDECEKRAEMTPEMMIKSQYAQKRLQAGIHPDDFDAYDRKEMLGYNPDGSYIPGQNFQYLDDDEGEDDDGNDDDDDE